MVDYFLIGIRSAKWLCRCWEHFSVAIIAMGKTEWCLHDYMRKKENKNRMGEGRRWLFHRNGRLFHWPLIGASFGFIRSNCSNTKILKMLFHYEWSRLPFRFYSVCSSQSGQRIILMSNASVCTTVVDRCCESLIYNVKVQTLRLRKGEERYG